MTADAPLARIPAWFDRWGPILPLLAAEFIVWLGFGGLLPVLPLYFHEQGIDLATLGIVIAAWPIARLVFEPIFGWLADRTARVPLMVLGLLLTALFEVLPLFVIGPLAFVILRGLAGIAAAMYDPAARGYLTDATPPERRGEAFGLYAAAQMGGLLIGPAIGAFGAGAFGGHRLRLRVQCDRHGRRRHRRRPRRQGDRRPHPSRAVARCDRVPARHAVRAGPGRRRCRCRSASRTWTRAPRSAC